MTTNTDTNPIPETPAGVPPEQGTSTEQEDRLEVPGAETEVETEEGQQRTGPSTFEEWAYDRMVTLDPLLVTDPELLKKRQEELDAMKAEEEGGTKEVPEETMTEPEAPKQSFLTLEDIGEKLLSMISESLVDVKKVYRKHIPVKKTYRVDREVAQRVRLTVYPEPNIFEGPFFPEGEYNRPIDSEGSSIVTNIVSCFSISGAELTGDLDALRRKYLRHVSHKFAERIDQDVRKVVASADELDSVTFASVQSDQAYLPNEVVWSGVDEATSVSLVLELFRDGRAGVTALRIDTYYVVVDEFKEGFLR